MIKLSDFYKSIFGCKVYKVSLNAGCTCPNRDGTKGKCGCIFCSQAGSGDFIKKSPSIGQQFEAGKKLIEAKGRGRSGKEKLLYLPYFQAFTSTYGKIDELKEKYQEALLQKDVCGLAIATRPDCLPDEMLLLLKKITEKELPATGKPAFLQLELGLQTSNESTGKLINRCYTNEDYKNTVEKIKTILPEAHIVTHVIFGLPGESKTDMMETVRFVFEVNKPQNSRKARESLEKSITQTDTDFFGIKITNLYVLKDTVLGKLFEEEKYVPLSCDEYFSLLESAMPLLNENCVIHRLSGDPPKSEVLAPLWGLEKKKILCRMNKLFNEN